MVESVAAPTLIYCASGNKRFAQIAIESGFEYGAKLPHVVHFPPYFADQDWKKPNRAGYMAALAKHRPQVATVIDWEEQDQLSEVLSWAEEASQYVEVVIIIPKVPGGISQIPRRVDGKEIRLGYSVPTKYGGTELMSWEFAGWPVHLLGGSPQAQMRIAPYFNVVSTDGNMAMKMASRYCMFWSGGNARYASNRWWPTLAEAGLSDTEEAMYSAFQMSCQNIYKAWLNFGKGN